MLLSNVSPAKTGKLHTESNSLVRDSLVAPTLVNPTVPQSPVESKTNSMARKESYMSRYISKDGRKSKGISK